MIRPCDVIGLKDAEEDFVIRVELCGTSTRPAPFWRKLEKRIANRLPYEAAVAVLIVAVVPSDVDWRRVAQSDAFPSGNETRQPPRGAPFPSAASATFTFTLSKLAFRPPLARTTESFRFSNRFVSLSLPAAALHCVSRPNQRRARRLSTTKFALFFSKTAAHRSPPFLTNKARPPLHFNFFFLPPESVDG